LLVFGHIAKCATFYATSNDDAAGLI
jgi:hypothetical protein